MEPTWTRVVRGLVVAFLMAGVALLTVASVVPGVAGAASYSAGSAIATDAPAGSLLVVRPVDASRVAVGDTVAYRASADDAGTLTTGEVVRVHQQRGLGDRIVVEHRVDGVAQSTRIDPAQVDGRVWYSLPWVGVLNDVGARPAVQLWLWAIGVGALVHLLAWSVGTARERRRDLDRLAAIGRAHGGSEPAPSAPITPVHPVHAAAARSAQRAYAERHEVGV